MLRGCVSDYSVTRGSAAYSVYDERERERERERETEIDDSRFISLAYMILTMKKEEEEEEDLLCSVQ